MPQYSETVGDSGIKTLKLVSILWSFKAGIDFHPFSRQSHGDEESLEMDKMDADAVKMKKMGKNSYPTSERLPFACPSGFGSCAGWAWS